MKILIGTKEHFSEDDIVKIAKAYGIIPSEPNKR